MLLFRSDVAWTVIPPEILVILEHKQWSYNYYNYKFHREAARLFERLKVGPCSENSF